METSNKQLSERICKDSVQDLLAKSYDEDWHADFIQAIMLAKIAYQQEKQIKAWENSITTAKIVSDFIHNGCVTDEQLDLLQAIADGEV